MIEHRNNTVQEQQAAYAATGAKQDHALVRELWAVPDFSSLPGVKDIEKFDDLVKSRILLLFVIPMKMGIQGFQLVKHSLDSRLRGNDGSVR